MRRRLLSCLAALAVSLPLALAVAPDGPASASSYPAFAVDWEGSSAPVAAGEEAAAVVSTGSLPAGTVLRVTAEGGRVSAVPDGCTTSSIIHERSSITADGGALRCRLRPRADELRVVVVVTAPSGSRVAVEVAAAGAVETTPARSSAGGRVAPAAYRFLSSPDFLNADVADLRGGRASWTPQRSENSINPAYRTALDRVLDAFDAERPGAVLVAGDMVEGRWGVDPRGTGNFGPVETLGEQRAAVRRAAATYYPQWLERFRARGLQVLPAVGDHELGDNPWNDRDRRLVPTFERAWVRWFARRPDGSPRWTDRPRGSRQEHMAYAVRPVPEVQLVTLDVFDTASGAVRVRVDGSQLRWLRGVLRRAQRDGVPWVVVQGHAPVLPVDRLRGSSSLRVEGGADSALWRTFRRYGVDLYLAGEVHDVGVAARDGVVQVTHGGLFQYGLTNYLRADVHEDRLELQLRDFDAHVADAPDGSRLWETRSPGMKKRLRVAPEPFTIGTLTLGADGSRDASGVLVPGR